MSTMNRLRLGYEFLTIRSPVRSHPVLISVEPTNRCNLNCIMCPTNAPSTPDQRDRGDMSMETYARIIDQLAPAKNEEIGLIGGGDPLLGKNTLNMLEFNRSRNVKTILFTNGIALSPTKSKNVLNTEIGSIHFSIDGATKETYESIRLGGKFEKVVNNVIEFCRMKVEMNKKTRVYVQMIVSSKTLHEVEQFYSFWSNVKGVDHVRFKSEIDHLFENEKTADVPTRKKCFLPWYMCHFRWNGEVYFCYQDWMCTMAPANINEQDLVDIINSKTMTHNRQLMKEGKTEEIDLCSTCTVHQPTGLETVGALLFSEPNMRRLLPYYEYFQYKRIKSLSKEMPVNETSR